MTTDDLTPDQQAYLENLKGEMLQQNAETTLDRWVGELVEYRRACRKMGSPPSFVSFVTSEQHRGRSRHPRLVMVALGVALWRAAEEVEKRG